MVKSIRLFFCFVLLLAIVGINNIVFAAEEAFSVTYDMDNQSLIYSGCTTVSNELITITVLPEEGEPEVEALSEQNSVIRSKRTAIGGVFEGVLEISQKLKSNSYIFKITGTESGYKKTYPFAYISETEAAGVFELLKKAKTDINYAEFKKTVTENCLPLGLNRTKVLENEVFVKMLYGYAPDGGYDIKSFYAIQRFVTAIVDIRNIEDNSVELLDDLITAYSAELGVDVEKYSLLSNTIKVNFISRIKNASEEYLSSQADTENVYFENMFFAQLNSTENYSKMREVVFEYAEDIALDLTKYNSSKLSESERNSVFKEIYDSSINSIEELKSLFIKLTDKYYSNSPASGGSGGSGGGGGSSPSVGFVSASVIEKTENTNIEKKNSYADMKNHWASEYVEALSDKGIIEGYDNNTFLPEKNITRAEFTKLICECFDITSHNIEVFSDVKPTAWYFTYVSGAYKAGVISGYDGRFIPDTDIKREDAAVILYNAIKYSGKSGYLIAVDYKDANSISGYALEAVGYLQAESIMEGNNGIFNAQSKTTRAQAAALIYRVLNLEDEI